jgi:putative ABC transport system permease protein
MFLTESLKMAWRTLSANRMRSFLTVLGIIIGNASIIAMVGVGQGAQTYAKSQFKALGTNVLTIMRGSAMSRGTFSQPNTLVWADAEAIAKYVPAVQAVAPSLNSSEPINRDGQVIQTTITGTTPDYVTVRNSPVQTGQFFTDDDVRRNACVTVLGSQLAQSLFAGRPAVGASLRIHNISFTVVGVLAEKGSGPGPGGNQDNAAVVPITTMANRLVGRTSPFGIAVQNIAVTAVDEASMEAAQYQITNLLRQRHKLTGDDDFEIRNQQDALAAANNIAEVLTILLTATAAISLLVGGIGIMNIMLVSVTERTQEIGLRKAIGAGEGDILSQFMIEATILSLVGGVMGTLGGVGLVFLIRVLSPLQASVSFGAIALAVGVSGSIGLVFGVVPARRAARLDPIVALRST